MERLTRTVSAVALVASPLLFLAYFVLYPAYGEFDAAGIARDLSADPGRTRVADVFAFAGAFLAVPAMLAFLRMLRPASPRLAILGGGLAVIGWVALVGVLMTDIAAAEIGADVALFEAFYSNPIVVGLSAVATLHIVGGVLLGLALVRTRLVAVPLAVAFTVAVPVHLPANLAVSSGSTRSPGSSRPPPVRPSPPAWSGARPARHIRRVGAPIPSWPTPE